jgi:hypothetical protein
MRRRLLLLSALLVAVPATAAPGLWVVRDDDTEITLYGTIHALPKGMAWFAPAAQARLDAADTLVVEAIIPDDKAALSRLVADLGTRPGLKPLLARIGRDAAPGLAEAAARVGLPLAHLDRLETWLAAVTISEVSLTSIGISAEDGVEPALMRRARAASKPIVGLESIEQQLRYFDALPEADQIKMLEATVVDTKSARVDTDRLVALWQAGDVEAIASDFAAEAKASPLLKKVLITNRNRRWADWIAGVMKRPGKVFIAVGAGHFGGADGLLALLAARGLPAERLLPGGGANLPSIAARNLPRATPLEVTPAPGPKSVAKTKQVMPKKKPAPPAPTGKRKAKP